jgi:hypothetical protein
LASKSLSRFFFSCFGLSHLVRNLRRGNASKTCRIQDVLQRRLQPDRKGRKAYQDRKARQDRQAER